MLCIHIYTYNIPRTYIRVSSVSSSDRMVKPKFDQLHTWYDETKGRTSRSLSRREKDNYYPLLTAAATPTARREHASGHVIASEHLCNHERAYM